MAALADRPDILHYHGLGPALVAPLPRYLSRVRVVQTVHGLDNQRAKWSRAARAVLGTAHWLSGLRAGRPHRGVPRAGRALPGPVRRRHPATSPTASPRPARMPARQITTRFGLTPGGYLLLVGRLVPEKAADLLIRAFRRHPAPSSSWPWSAAPSFTDDYVDHAARGGRRRPADRLHRLRLRRPAGRALHQRGRLRAAVPPRRAAADPAGSRVVRAAAGRQRHPAAPSSCSAPTRRAAGCSPTATRTTWSARWSGCSPTRPPNAAGPRCTAHRVRAEYTWDAAARDIEQLYLRPGRYADDERGLGCGTR